MTNQANECHDKGPTPAGPGLVIVVVLYILLAIILGSFTRC